MKKFITRKNMTLLPVYDEQKTQLLKSTICKGINNQDFEIFLHICKRTGLDPFSKQIYAIPRGNQMTIQTSIDGYRLIAERTGKYSPGREPTFEITLDGKLVSSTSYVKKMTSDGTWHEVGATAYYDEYVQSYNGKPSQFWNKMPRVMLAKCAESLALRRAFPAELSGIYTEDEMKQADIEIKDTVIENNELILDESISSKNLNILNDLIADDKELHDLILLRTQKSALELIPEKWSSNIIDFVKKIKEKKHAA
jgi:phage recombination protein Bet